MLQDIHFLVTGAQLISRWLDSLLHRCREDVPVHTQGGEPRPRGLHRGVARPSLDPPFRADMGLSEVEDCSLTWRDRAIAQMTRVSCSPDLMILILCSPPCESGFFQGKEM